MSSPACSTPPLSAHRSAWEGIKSHRCDVWCVPPCSINPEQEQMLNPWKFHFRNGEICTGMSFQYLYCLSAETVSNRNDEIDFSGAQIKLVEQFHGY